MSALAVSVANASATSIVAYERAPREAGVSGAQVRELARLAAVVKAASRLP